MALYHPQPVSNGRQTLTCTRRAATWELLTHVASCCPQLIMPSTMEETLEREGFLYLEQRHTDREFNISTRRSVSPRAPFHITCTLPVSCMWMRLESHVALTGVNALQATCLWQSRGRIG